MEIIWRANKIILKINYLNDDWHMSHDDKEINLKIFKLNLANCLNFIDEEQFTEIFG